MTSRPPETDQLADDLAQWNVPDDIKQEMLAQVEPEPTFKIWPENKPAWDAFLTISTQLNIAPNGRVIGINYPAAETGWRLSNTDITPGIFEKIRIIEQTLIEQQHGK